MSEDTYYNSSEMLPIIYISMYCFRNLKSTAGVISIWLFSNLCKCLLNGVPNMDKMFVQSFNVIIRYL